MHNESEPYIPSPIDTSAIRLPEELMRLGEMLARNTHENYVKQRIRDGWRYGPERNDELKTNPTLIPYDDLPESEKDYDRITSAEALKVIVALGYEIATKKQ